MKINYAPTSLRLAVICLLVLAAGGTRLEGAEGPGTTGASYLTLPVSAKSIALGDIGVALPAEPFSWTINPSVLGTLEDAGFGVFHAEWILGTRYNSALVHYRLHPKLVLGIGTIFTYRPEIQGYSEQGIETEKLKANNYQILAGIGTSPVPALSLGVTVKVFNEKLGHLNAGGTAFDIGTVFTPIGTNLSFGVAVRNIGGNITFEEIDEPLPLTTNIGICYRVSPDIGSSTMLLALDLAKSRYSEPFMAGGVELIVQEMIAFRVGYNGQKDRPGSGLSAGGGIRISDLLSLDYAWSALDDLGNMHRISLYFKIR